MNDPILQPTIDAFSKQKPCPKVKLTERALYQRINRKLRQDDERLRTSRSERSELSVGRYYILDTNRNFIVCQHVDLEEMGRELGVIQPWEELEGVTK